MQPYINNLHYVPSFLSLIIFLIIWIAFPIWFAMRRKQGLIQIGRRDCEGSGRISGRIVDRYFELGIFFFAIPFTTFFIFVIANLILSPFITEASARFDASIEAASLVMDIVLILYIYLVERKIRLDRIKKNK